MTDDHIQRIYDRLERQDKMLESIYGALVGNDSLGHKGLVPRVSALEGQVAEHNKKLVLAGGIVIGAQTVLSFLKSKIGGG